jgi:hypothetical protein
MKQPPCHYGVLLSHETGGCSLRFKPEALITGLCLVATFCDFPNKKKHYQGQPPIEVQKIPHSREIGHAW